MGGRARPIGEGDRPHQASTECDRGAGKFTLPVGQADTGGTRGRSSSATEGWGLVLEGRRRRDRQAFDIAWRDRGAGRVGRACVP